MKVTYNENKVSNMVVMKVRNWQIFNWRHVIERMNVNQIDDGYIIMVIRNLFRNNFHKINFCN